MKLTRKSIGRIAASFVATAMLATMAIVPASAANDPGYFESSNFTITKTLKLPENTYAPAKGFTFNVAPASASNQSLTSAEQNKGVEYGVTDGVNSSATATINANQTATNNQVTADASFSVDLSKFTHAGSYKYVVTEASTDNDDFKYDDNTLILYVNIINGAKGLEVKYVELVDPDGGTAGAAAKINGFTNEYGKNNDGNDKVYDITLKKVIAGDAANMNATFAFDVSVESEYNNNTVLIVDTNGNGTYGDTITVGEGEDAKEVKDETYTLKADGSVQKISLGHNETAKIFGLTDGDTYTITEQNVTTKDNDAVTSDGYTVTVDGVTDTDNDGSVSGTISADTAITYTNTRNASTPTGIMMDIAPYAVLVVIAAAGCFIFLRKRHAKED